MGVSWVPQSVLGDLPAIVVAQAEGEEAAQVQPGHVREVNICTSATASQACHRRPKPRRTSDGTRLRENFHHQETLTLNRPDALTPLHPRPSRLRLGPWCAA